MDLISCSSLQMESLTPRRAAFESWISQCKVGPIQYGKHRRHVRPYRASILGYGSHLAWAELRRTNERFRAMTEDLEVA